MTTFLILAVAGILDFMSYVFLAVAVSLMCRVGPKVDTMPEDEKKREVTTLGLWLLFFILGWVGSIILYTVA